MKTMVNENIKILLRESSWATLCMVAHGNTPYAIEFEYFLDNDDICGLVNPRGKAASCLEHNQNVCVKICDLDNQCQQYRAISCFGTAYFEKLTDPTQIAWAWDSLEARLQRKNGKYSSYKSRYLETGRAMPLLRILVNDYSGKTNFFSTTTAQNLSYELAYAIG